MDFDQSIERLVAATQRLEATVKTMSSDAVRDQSFLPGWSRGHVLTHLARNADGFRNFLIGARSGEIVPMYASLAARDLDIEYGARRPAEQILDDAAFSSRNFVVDVRSTPVDVLSSFAVHARGSTDGPRIQVAEVLRSRLSEVEIHHVDLGWTYGFADSPGDVLEVLIGRCMERLSVLGIAPVVLTPSDLPTHWESGDATFAARVSGPASALLGWLTRRSDGADLKVENGFSLPDVPSLG
jgi:maleylpyruvate isomerase